ncbi:MAG TPA: carbohydrate-binding family V/XII [Candidatus Eisenbacteria bacterium]|nr:carbohydrate-binding family V/XII [Candidatus Eisenbacteria bacterium]
MTRVMVPVISFALLALAPTIPAYAADPTWPREITTQRGLFTVYQPQPETFSGNTLTGRAALSLTRKSDPEPVFGVMWFRCRVDTDRGAGTATLRDITVTNVRWPESKEEQEREIAEFLTSLWSKTVIPISLDRLKASLESAEKEQKSLDGIKNEPPKFVVVEEKAELLLYDGEPRAFDIPNTDFEHFANTAFAVVRDKKSGTCYLNGGAFWYRATGPEGPWTPISSPPADVAKLMPKSEKGSASVSSSTKPPRIVVATEPSELISTDGPPKWKPIGKGELLYIQNSETPVLREVASGQLYLLASGRWYRAKSLDGPWTFVRGDKLPSSFQGIPPESELGSARVSVAGTEEAEEAVLDAQVPQTAAINRSTAKLEVRYDGDPKFKKIDGTSVEYAVNTSAQVLRIKGKYYACDNGVWFTSSKATGPWKVADDIPEEEIDRIPPSSPVYNVTHVTVYESTPQVVYVGYTPGYLWSYPYYGVPIYGTGWYYPPYWGPGVYYPRPCAWGFHVSYNPWTGWGFGFSYSTGFMTIGMTFGGGYGGYYRPGYWGGYHRPPGYYPPGGYRPPAYRPPNRPGYPGNRPRPTPHGGRGQASTLPAGNNLYQGAGNRNRVASSDMKRDAGRQKADRVAKGPNNVYGDRNGNVHRQTPSGWQSRDQGSWKSSGNSPSTQDLSRDASARQRGAYGSSGGSRGYSGGRSGGTRGGGRRR